MNRDEYTQLVQASEVFKKLDKDFQKEILKAEGSEKEQYIAIFTTEQKGIVSAQKELIENTTDLVEGLENDVQKAKKGFLKSAKASVEKAEEEKAELLLNSL